MDIHQIFMPLAAEAKRNMAGKTPAISPRLKWKVMEEMHKQLDHVRLEPSAAFCMIICGSLWHVNQCPYDSLHPQNGCSGVGKPSEGLIWLHWPSKCAHDRSPLAKKCRETAETLGSFPGAEPGSLSTHRPKFPSILPFQHLPTEQNPYPNHHIPITVITSININQSWPAPNLLCIVFQASSKRIRGLETTHFFSRHRPSQLPTATARMYCRKDGSGRSVITWKNMTIPFGSLLFVRNKYDYNLWLNMSYICNLGQLGTTLRLRHLHSACRCDLNGPAATAPTRCWLRAKALPSCREMSSCSWQNGTKPSSSHRLYLNLFLHIYKGYDLPYTYTYIIVKLHWF